MRPNAVRVRFADLNLRTMHDQIRLRHRVGGAIERVCDIDLGRDGLQDRGLMAAPIMPGAGRAADDPCPATGHAWPVVDGRGDRRQRALNPRWSIASCPRGTSGHGSLKPSG